MIFWRSDWFVSFEVAIRHSDKTSRRNLYSSIKIQNRTRNQGKGSIVKSLSKQFLTIGLMVCTAFVIGCSNATEETDQANLTAENEKVDDSSSSTKTEEAPTADMSQPDVAIQAMFNELASGKPQAFWNAMPASYQADVNGLVQEFAGKMDPEIWGQTVGVIKQLATVLKSKKDLILNGNLASQAPVDKKDAETAITHFAGILDTIANSDLSDLDKMKGFKGQAFTSTTGEKLFTDLFPLMEIADKQNADGSKTLADFKNSKFSLVSQDGDKAVLQMEGEEDTKEFVKVEGKWIPSEMQADWKQGIESAKQQLAAITPEMVEQQKPMVTAMMGTVSGILTKLEKAETKEDFEKELQSAMMPMMGLLGPFMGGGGSPGMGGPGGTTSSPPKEAPEGFTPPPKKKETEKEEK